MDPLTFAARVVLLTASGALAPGPLFFATASHGARSGAKSGVLFSVAHTLVEFTLVILLACGLITVANQPLVKSVAGIAGGIVLLVFGSLQIRDSLTSKAHATETRPMSTRNFIVTGLVFTGLNPFFIVWWLTVGANLILESLRFASLMGVVFMYVCHVWIDYAWLTLVAHFSKRGRNVVGFKWFRRIMATFGCVLIYFGLTFLSGSIPF